MFRDHDPARLWRKKTGPLIPGGGAAAANLL
jgi:hypothetical protein